MWRWPRSIWPTSRMVLSPARSSALAADGGCLKGLAFPQAIPLKETTEMTPNLTVTEVQEIRSHFPILREKTYVSSCSQGALSIEVEAALRDYIASWHQYGTPWDRWVAHYEELRAAFAAFIG